MLLKFISLTIVYINNVFEGWMKYVTTYSLRIVKRIFKLIERRKLEINKYYLTGGTKTMMKLSQTTIHNWNFNQTNLIIIEIKFLSKND